MRQYMQTKNKQKTTRVSMEFEIKIEQIQYNRDNERKVIQQKMDQKAN